MIADWRKQWGIPNFPFYMVQLANFKPETVTPQNEIWSYVREAQANVANDDHVGMACIIDIGEAGDIHPRNKVDVGDRLALNALKYDYGKEVLARGPIMKEVKLQGNKAVVTFNLQGSKLMVTNKYGYINGFAVAGPDKQFHYARAHKISKDQVEVESDNVEDIAAVRFLWADNPGAINLYNTTGLPAEPFRTDSW
jgi:sialate O-acetylesterase